jgi:putative ATP-grasp target RiPP
MSAVLPLPLELTQPMELASSLEDSLKDMFQVGTMKYNPETQVRETPDGVPMIYNGGGHGTSSNQESESNAGLLNIDVTVDVQIDDNDF